MPRPAPIWPRCPADLRARSDAYTEGGYWIQVWSFLISAAILILLLRTGLSRRFRDWAERRSRRRPIQTFLYYVLFTLAATVLAFPWTVYTGFVREHAYRLATQTFGGWMRDQLVALGVTLVLGGLAVAVLYEVLRRFPRAWPALGAAVSLVFVVIGALIAPVFIAPLFNRYTLLTDARIRGADPPAGARERHRRRPGVRDGRLASDHAHQRQRLRAPRHRAHHAQRQPAAPRIAAGDRSGDGARDGALRAAPRLPVHHVLRAGDRGAGSWSPRGFRLGRRRWGERWGVRGDRRSGRHAAADPDLLGRICSC